MAILKKIDALNEDYITQSDFANLVPCCDNINFILTSVSGIEHPCVMCWYCGDDQYEQQMTGIIVKAYINGKWQVVFNEDKYELLADFIAINPNVQDPVEFICKAVYNTDKKFRLTIHCEDGKWFTKTEKIM